MKKKSILFLLCPLLLFCLDGCRASTPVIEDPVWELRFASLITDQTATVSYASDPIYGNESTVIILCTLSAEGGVFSIDDQTTNQSFSGEYRKTSSTPDSHIYWVQIGETEGSAVVAYTTYADGTKEATLAMSMGDYTLQFYEKKA